MEFLSNNLFSILSLIGFLIVAWVVWHYLRHRQQAHPSEEEEIYEDDPYFGPVEDDDLDLPDNLSLADERPDLSKETSPAEKIPLPASEASQTNQTADKKSSSANAKNSNAKNSSTKVSPDEQSLEDIVPVLPPEQATTPIEPPPKKRPKKKRVPELIIALYVLPEGQEGFRGPDIFTVLQDQGLQYGDMKIFHHYGVGEVKLKKSLFSVANIFEPGTFDNERMENFWSPGLVFFMQLPGPFGGRVTFELMLNVGQRVAEGLEGVLVDDQHYILVPETITTLRERIVRYEQRLAEA